MWDEQGSRSGPHFAASPAPPQPSSSDVPGTAPIRHASECDSGSAEERQRQREREINSSQGGGERIEDLKRRTRGKGGKRGGGIQRE